MPIILDAHHDLYMYGVIPISLIQELEDSRQPDQPLDYARQDWKSKEQASEDFLFYVETLNQEQVIKLNLYADSFIHFIERTFLDNRTLKVVRIGLRLLRKYSFFVSTDQNLPIFFAYRLRAASL